MTEFTSFQKAYNECRAEFNTKKRGVSTTSDIAPVNTDRLSVITLATVALMLVHNSVTDHESGLNIDTLQDYDLDKFRDREMFRPYIAYLIKKGKHTGKAMADDNLYAMYVTLMIRYLFIAQQRGVTLLGD